MIDKVYAVYFSPSGNTEKIVKEAAYAAANELGVKCEIADFTLPEHREGNLRFRGNELLFVGTPVYAGRVPNKLMPFIKGNINTEATSPAVAVPVVTYGNRNFDDALMELFTILEDNGFLMAGAAAVPCEHVFDKRLAGGKPDEEDIDQAKEYGITIAKRAKAIINGSEKAVDRARIPGNDPVGPYYVPKGRDGAPAKFLKAKPVTDVFLCIGCGKCSAVCPMGNFRENVLEASGICIKCQACIKACPQAARYFDDEAFLSHVDMLVENFANNEPKPIWL